MIVEDRACYPLAILHDHGNRRVQVQTRQPLWVRILIISG